MCIIFGEIRRQKCYPLCNNEIESLTNFHTGSERESNANFGSESKEDKLDDADVSASSDGLDDAISSTFVYLDVLKRQKEIGNQKPLKFFKANDAENLKFIAEVRRRKGQRAMPRIWDQNNHPVTFC